MKDFLKERLALLNEGLLAINDKAAAENRTVLTESENKEWDKLDGEAENIRKRLRVLAAVAADNAPIEDRGYEPFATKISEQRAASGRMFREALTRNCEIALELRESVTATTAANAINAIPVYIKDFVEPLEKGLIFDKLGVKMEYGLSGDIKYPVMPYIEASIADEGVKLEDTTLAPGAITPKPRRLGVTCPLTGLANVQTDMRLYNWLLNELAKSVARAINRWMFMTVAAATDVYGVFAYNKDKNPIESVTFKAASPTYKELVAMRGKVMTSGAQNDGTYAYVMSAAMYTELETTPKVANGEQMILVDGKIGGIPVFITEEIECTGKSGGKSTYNVTPKHVGFGRFSDVKVGQFGQFKLIVNPYTGDTADVTRITVNAHWAVDTLRRSSFVIGTITAAS